MVNLFLGYFFVDPSREMFSFPLPFLGRPLLWYGFLFAFGFFVAYFILIYLLRRYFLRFPKVEEKDILDFHGLIYSLKNPHDKTGERCKEVLFSQIGKKRSEFYLQSKLPSVIPAEVKKELIQALNHMIQGEEFSLQKNFPFSNYLERFFSADHKRQAANRFSLEESFPGVFITTKLRAKTFAEKLSLYVMVGAVVGARLGDVFFYQNWKFYLVNPLSIIKTWEGGLASHGGVIGILLALTLFYQRIKSQEKEIKWIDLVDFCVIPTAFAAAFIRIGNFMNQEILGTVTTLPWGVVFGHPVDGQAGTIRHPVQIYEALFYFTVGITLFALWKKKAWFLERGRLSGVFLVAVFGFRFFIEFLKEEQSVWLSTSSFLDMGQCLSIPCILLGCYLLFRKKALFQKLSLKRNER
ncbi:MAG: prolipoprotein diacylglyceryl transferase [Chlamydiae bacterium]|nr:prolipoprotein diacylglyceryl transferase [Chlamydiota bacterium]